MPADLTSLPIAALVGIFFAAGFLVWEAGTRLTGFVNAFAEQTGLGKAFTGMLFLGGITSLPEVAAVSTSAAIGNAPLAVNNLLGTASINLILMAIADVMYGRNALSAAAASPATLMQGVLSMLLAVLVALIATFGDVPMFGVGFGSTSLVLASVVALWLASSFENRHVWEVVEKDGSAKSGASAAQESHIRAQSGEHGHPRNALVIRIGIAAALILVGGFMLSTSADALAQRSGISAGMVGFVLVGLSTSLPEISSITAAIRLRQYDMAVGDIFGTNIFNFSLIFLADAVYSGDPVLTVSGKFEVAGALLATLLTGVFLVGLLERRATTVFRMGFDSLAAIAAFAVGVLALAQI